jgi:hypothetical protein
MRTTVVNIKYEPYDIYIGRAGHGRDGYFGNPFPLTDEDERVLVLQRYEEHFYGRLETDPEFKRRVLELKGKRLGCFCKPRLCHGDIIAEYVNNS